MNDIILWHVQVYPNDVLGVQVPPFAHGLELQPPTTKIIIISWFLFLTKNFKNN